MKEDTPCYHSIMDGFQLCRICEYQKPIDEFHKGHKKCKPCFNEYQRKRYKENPRKAKGYKLSRYGLTIDQYESMLKQQDYKCAICKTDKSGGKGDSFYVDHNHKTNAVRALLCHNCNYVIGYAKEKVSTLELAASYLEYWEGVPLQR